MEFPVIPWNVFLDALQRQQPSTMELWLRRWLFTNEGVIMETSAWQESICRSNSGAADHASVQA